MPAQGVASARLDSGRNVTFERLLLSKIGERVSVCYTAAKRVEGGNGR